MTARQTARVITTGETVQVIRSGSLNANAEIMSALEVDGCMVIGHPAAWRYRRPRTLGFIRPQPGTVAIITPGRVQMVPADYFNANYTIVGDAHT